MTPPNPAPPTPDREQASRVASAITLGAVGLPPQDYLTLALVFRAYEAALAAPRASEPTDEKRETFVKGLASAINRVSAENGSDTPDFILAEFLADCQAAFDKAVHQRSQWYGYHQSIGAAAPSPSEPRNE